MTADRDVELERAFQAGAERGRELLDDAPLTPEQAARYSLLIWPAPGAAENAREAS